jgi:hypothetical protein
MDASDDLFWVLEAMPESSLNMNAPTEDDAKDDRFLKTLHGLTLSIKNKAQAHAQQKGSQR